MSDVDYDEDEYYDEDDYYWIEDEALDLADDLAEHALPSPVFQDDPHIDSLNGYSDWEYYSDDYWDEDPSTAQKICQQPSTSGEAQKREASRSRKKRKRTEQSNAPLKRSKPLKTGLRPDQVFYGTVWKTDAGRTDEKEEYTPGQQKAVGLLKNWRDVFRDSQPRSDERREDRHVAGKKRKTQTSVDEELEAQEVGSLNGEEAPHCGRRSSMRKRSKVEQDLTARNHESIDSEPDGEPEPTPPPKRRPKVEMREIQERQNGVVTKTTVTTAVERTTRSLSRKRPRPDEADEPPPKSKRIASQPAKTEGAQNPEDHSPSRSTRASQKRKS